MNHDYAHCLDYKKGKCLKKKCFRAELVEDLKNYIGDSSMVTWASLRGTKYCEMGWEENRMDDLISRQAAIDACIRVREHRAYDEIEEIKALPSAERRGKWIDPEDSTCYKCSVCGEYATQEYSLTEPIFWQYCPNCGAKMLNENE